MKKKLTNAQDVELALELYIRQRKQGRLFWSALKVFTRFLGHERVGEAILKATEDDAFRFRSYLTVKYSSATASNRIVLIRGMLRALRDKGVLPQNVFAMVRTPKRTANRVRWNRGLTDKEIDAVIAACKREPGVAALRDVAVLELLFCHGLRLGEVLSVTMRDYDGGRILISNTKEGSSIWLDLSEEERSAIACWLSVRGIGTGVLFCSVSRDGGLNLLKRPVTETVNKRIRKYCESAGVPQFTSHSGRVSAITRALEMGYSYEDVRAFSRHASIQMIEAYDRRERRRITIRRNNG